MLPLRLPFFWYINNIFFMNAQDPTVSLHAYPFGAEIVKVDVQIKDVPADLFGAAFHLVLEGVDDAGWSLHKYELGNVFALPEGEIMALVSTRNKPKNELVAGISLKRDAVIEAKDGTLLSFYVRVEHANSIALRFEDAVLSVLEEQRVDLPNVTWQEARIDLHPEMQASVLAGSEESSADLSSADALWSPSHVLWVVLAGAVILVFLLFVRFRSSQRR